MFLFQRSFNRCGIMTGFKARSIPNILALGLGSRLCIPVLQESLEEQQKGFWGVPRPAGSCVLVFRGVLGSSWVSHNELQEILFSTVRGGSSLHSDCTALIPLPNDAPSACSPTEQSRVSFFVLTGSLRGKAAVLVSPFLVKAAARDGGMEMCVIHSFCFKYVKVLKTDFHISYAKELFYLYASLRKTGKTKNIRHLQMVEKSSESLFWCWFLIKSKFYFWYQRSGSPEVYLPKPHLTFMTV